MIILPTIEIGHRSPSFDQSAQLGRHDCPLLTPTCRSRMSAVGQPNVPFQRPRGGAGRSNRLLSVIVPLAPEYNMGGFRRRNELNAFISQSAHVNPPEQSL